MRARTADGDMVCKSLLETKCKDTVGCSYCDLKTGDCLACDSLLGFVYSKAEKICYHDHDLMQEDFAGILKPAFLLIIALLLTLI